jgi:hypothetical protein
MEMTRPTSGSGLGSEFDDFLFAVIGEDRNGTALSVVSVLARMDLDPWQEAARLAAMSEEMAAQRLAPLLAALPARTLQQTSPEATAVRLIALLPRRMIRATHPSVQELGTAAVAHPRDFTNVILIAIYMILSLGIQFFVVRGDRAMRTNTVHVPAAATAPSQTPPATSGK